MSDHIVSDLELLLGEDVAIVLGVELVDFDGAVVHDVETFLLVLAQDVLGRLRNVNRPCLPVFFELVGHHHIWPVDVVSHYLGADDSSDDRAGVDSDPHVQLVEI